MSNKERKNGKGICRGTEKIETRQEARKFIRRERRTWTEVSGRISMEDWREHFMTRLDGTSQQQTNAARRTEGEEEKVSENDNNELADEEMFHIKFITYTKLSLSITTNVII